MTLDADQRRNYSGAFAATREWCRPRGLDPAPYIDRVAMVLTTESNGRMHANDGAAFPDQGETPWTEGMSLAQRCQVREVLRQSLDLPHDSVGSNGGSCGMFQQLPQDYVGARFPGKSWGWGSIPETMDIGKSTCMFLDKLQVTDDPVFRGLTFSSSITADVLRVQMPMVTESSSGNYGPARLAGALAIVTELSDITPADPIADTLEEIMSDRHVIEHVKADGKMWEANVLDGTYWHIPSPDALNARRAFLAEVLGNAFYDRPDPVDLQAYGVQRSKPADLFRVWATEINGDAARNYSFGQWFSVAQDNVQRAAEAATMAATDARVAATKIDTLIGQVAEILARLNESDPDVVVPVDVSPAVAS